MFSQWFEDNTFEIKGKKLTAEEVIKRIFKGPPSQITTEAVDYVKVGNYAVEISKGKDEKGEIYGLTVVKVLDTPPYFEYMPYLSGIFRSKDSVLEYLLSLKS